MINDFLLYLVQVSAGLALHSLVYKVFLEKLTFFEWNRFYLVTGLFACMLLPLVPALSVFSVFDHTPQGSVISNMQNTTDFSLRLVPLSLSTNPAAKNAFAGTFMYFLFMVYMSGLIYKSVLLIRSLSFLHKLRKNATLVRTGHFYKIYTQNIQPTFSFRKSIFLHADSARLSKAELEQVILHEQTHISQYHTGDILLFEIALAVFWFNPCLKYMAEELRKTHEYLVDRHVSVVTNNTVGYGELLVKLAMQHSGTRLAHTFSDSQIFSRIKMLTKPKTNPMQKFRFFTIVPMLALIVTVVFLVEGCKSENDDVSRPQGLGTTSQSDKQIISSISWEGNKKFTDNELTEFLGLRPGDPYDSLGMDRQLYGLQGKDIAARYMNDGHIFFRVEPSVATHGNKVDIKLKIYEGGKARIGKVIINGINKTDRKIVSDLISIKDGDGFTQSALLLAQSKLAKSGLFKSDSIMINPLVRGKLKGDDFTTVDMEFEVIEL